MAKKTIDKKFNSIPHLISNKYNIKYYEEFSRLEEGVGVRILVDRSRISFGAYFRGIEPISETKQRIFLEQNYRTQFGLINRSCDKVSEYILPTRGIIYTSEFEDGFVKPHKINSNGK